MLANAAMQLYPIRLERYERDKHFDLMNSWYRRWGYEPIPGKYMPHIGFVAGECVMQFLALTDCNVGWLEGFISDPGSDPELRRSSIHIVHEACADMARSLGIDRLFTFVRRQYVLDLAMEAFSENGIKATSTPGFLIEGSL